MKSHLHIGHIIQDKVKEEQISVSQFARELHCNRTNVYDIFERQSLDTNLLRRISVILNTDFFEILSNEMKDIDRYDV